MARHRSRLCRVRQDGRQRASIPDRRGAPGRPVGRPAAPRRRPGGRADGLSPAGAPGAAAPDAAHGRPPARLLQAGTGRRPRGVLVPVHRRGRGAGGHGPPPRRRGRRVLAPARGAKDGDHRAPGAARHPRRARRPAPRRGRRRGMADLRPRARHAVPPARPDAARGRVPAPLAGRHAHVGARRAAGRAPARRPHPLAEAPRVGRGVRIRGADPASAPAHALDAGARPSLAASAASPTFACGRPTAKDRGCRPGQAPGPTVSP